MKKDGIVRLMLASFVLAMFVGCGNSGSPEATIAASNKTNMDRVINLYERFQMRHKWKGPKDIEEFKTYVQGLGRKNVGANGSRTRLRCLCQRTR